jgi:predicted porin
MMMMKKLIPAAVLMTLVGAAQAQVTMYGLIDMSYGKNEMLGDTKDDIHSGGDAGQHGGSQGNSTTKVGLKGSTDVGSGVKANFQLETGGVHSDGSIQGSFFGRQAWAGFSGSFGEVRVGLQDSVAFQTMIGFDFNGAANAASAQANAGAGTFFGSNHPYERQVQYISPDLSGFKVQLGVLPAGNVAGAETVGAIGVTYTAGPFSAAVVGESKGTTTSKDFSSVAASYDLGVAKFMVGYATNAGGGNGKGASFGVVAPVAGVNVGFQISKNDDAGVTATEFFVNKEIFKGTYAYLDVGNVDKPSSKNAYAAGVIFTF